MGRIAPRRRKTTRIYQPLLLTWLNVSQRLKPGAAPTSEGAEPPSEPPPANDKMQQVKALLAKVWHLPDGFHGWSRCPTSTAAGC